MSKASRRYPNFASACRQRNVTLFTGKGVKVFLIKMIMCYNHGKRWDLWTSSPRILSEDARFPFGNSGNKCRRGLEKTLFTCAFLNWIISPCALEKREAKHNKSLP